MPESDAGGDRFLDLGKDAIGVWTWTDRLIHMETEDIRSQLTPDGLDILAFGCDQIAPPLKPTDNTFFVQQLQRLAHWSATGTKKFGNRPFQQNKPLGYVSGNDSLSQSVTDADIRRQSRCSVIELCLTGHWIPRPFFNGVFNSLSQPINDLKIQ